MLFRSYTDLVDVQELKIEDEEPLRKELESFINSAINKKPPVVTVDDGLAAVEAAERIVAAMTKTRV